MSVITVSRVMPGNTDALPLAHSVVLEDSGHVPQFEHPEATMALVRGFLAELPAS